MNERSIRSEPTPLNPPRQYGFVLVVDDEEQNRTLLRDPLESHGYEVEEAATGEQALEQVKLRLPDVILLDVMMPRMDGFEVCRRLKKDPLTASIPVFMVTALSERKERMMGISAGANDFLNKPVDLQDLILRIRNGVYTRRLFNQLQAEREKSERLLLSILPKAVAERMKRGEVNISDHHPEATVLVADLVGFSALSVHLGPEQTVCVLNEIFSAFDLLVEQCGLEKIKTIGDAYMVAGGLRPSNPNSAQAMAKLAFNMHEALARFNSDYNTSLPIRIGISTGPLVSGVIGRKKFAFDLWGEAVNRACQLEATCPPGSIQIDEHTYEQIQGHFQCSEARILEIKGGNRVAVRTLHAGLGSDPAVRLGLQMVCPAV